jgi:hypothetical protein
MYMLVFDSFEKKMDHHFDNLKTNLPIPRLDSLGFFFLLVENKRNCQKTAMMAIELEGNTGGPAWLWKEEVQC